MFMAESIAIARNSVKSEIGLTGHSNSRLSAQQHVHLFFCFFRGDFYFGLQKRGDYYDPPFKCRVPK